MSINTEPSTSATEWDRLWQTVRDAPDNFSCWEQLIRVAEEGGITKTSPPENITRLESVYDSFLSKFPLCFGYWKKYSDWELAVHGDESAEKVFERGVTAIHNSIDLWNQFIDFKLTHTASNDEIENLLERAASCIGLDFLAHPFWDKYIEFVENRLADPQRLLVLLDRIVLIPMHQYARYYEKWRGIRANMKPTEALDPTTLDLFYKEIREAKGDSLTPEEMETALKEKLSAQTTAVYKRTQDGTNKRWVYEAEIKRPYFHVKPLDRPQLQNWSKYLDFEESLNEIPRIRALYERCLVPCAQYEGFWLRYGQWLTGHDFLSDARSAYERAAFKFLPQDCCSAKIALALVLEEEGNTQEAKKIYTTILESIPNHVETILNYLHFERRQDPLIFENSINTFINSNQLDESAKAFFTIQYIRFLQQNDQIDKARQTYLSSSSLYPQSKFLWINYVNFELGFYDQSSEERILQVFEKARSHLSKDSQKEINTKFREYLLERSNSIYTLNRNPSSISTDFPPENQANSKRPAEDAAGYPYAKQPRFDTPAQGYGYAYPQQTQPNVGTEYYQQQTQQQPWQS